MSYWLWKPFSVFHFWNEDCIALHGIRSAGRCYLVMVCTMDSHLAAHGPQVPNLTFSMTIRVNSSPSREQELNPNFTSLSLSLIFFLSFFLLQFLPSSFSFSLSLDPVLCFTFPLSFSIGYNAEFHFKQKIKITTLSSMEA
jgi:hypothetical protein